MSIVHKPRYKLRPKAVSPEGQTSSPFFDIKQLASIYGFPVPPAQQTSIVGVISFGGGLYGVPANQASTYVLPFGAANCDVQNYWKYLGYTSVTQMPKVIIYPVGGAVNDLTDDGSTGENTLDISIIGGCYPSSSLTIILYLFPNSYSFSQVLPIALAGITVSGHKYVPSVISISWGLPEIYYLTGGHDTTGELTSVSNILKVATEAGINICAAAGDNGSTDGNGTMQLSVDFPASCPYVTSVGGTSLICQNKVYDASTNETVWNDGLLNGSFAATGGGVSAFYSKPTYQTKYNNASYRNVPDVAFNSDPETGLILYLNGQLQAGWGGTSMAAPMFAAYLALVKPTAFVNPLLYSSANSSNNFHDITQGNNYDISVHGEIKSYISQMGYDCCTGLGSINGANLKNVLMAVVPPVPSPIKLAKSIQINYASINLAKNNKIQLTGTILPTNATNKLIAWTSSNSAIVSVNQSGIVTGNKKGSILIRAATTDGTNKYAYTTVNVISTMRSIIFPKN